MCNLQSPFVPIEMAPSLQHGRSCKLLRAGRQRFYSPPNGDGGMLCMIDPQFLAPDGASSLGEAIAIGLLAETFTVLIINLLQATLDAKIASQSSQVRNLDDAPQGALPRSYAGSS